MATGNNARGERRQRSRLGDKARARRGKTQHVGRRKTSTPHLSNAGVAIRLAQFHAGRAVKQRMMQEHRRVAPPEQPRHADLPAGGCEQVLTTDDQIDAVLDVVDSDGPLIRPLTEPVADEHIARLFRRTLNLRPVRCVVESLFASLDADPKTSGTVARPCTFATGSRIPQFAAFTTCLTDLAP